MSNFFSTLVVQALRIFVPAITKAAKPKVENGDMAASTRDRLKTHIRKTWKMGSITVLAMLVFSASGCTAFTRTIYVPAGAPVRIRKTIKSAQVWVMGKDGKPVATIMDLPAGWYALPLPDDSKN